MEDNENKRLAWSSNNNAMLFMVSIIMRGKVIKKIRAMAREDSKDSPGMYDFYYKEAKKIYKKTMRVK